MAFINIFYVYRRTTYTKKKAFFFFTVRHFIIIYKLLFLYDFFLTYMLHLHTLYSIILLPQTIKKKKIFFPVWLNIHNFDSMCCLYINYNNSHKMLFCYYIAGFVGIIFTNCMCK